MGTGNRNDLNDIIRYGRQAVQRIRDLRTQPGTATTGASTPRQRALSTQGGVTNPSTNALASMRAQSTGVRATGATTLTPPTQRTWTPRTETPSYDERRIARGRTREDDIESQELRYQQAQARARHEQEKANAPFDAYLEQQGFGGDHPIGTGQYEDGNYAGFRTQGLMTAAVKGRGGALQDDAIRQAAEARAATDKLEHDAEYQRRLASVQMDDELDATMGTTGLDLNNPIRQHVSDVTYGNYENELAQWRAQEQERVTQGREFADEIEGIPYHQWAQLAATRDYGIDPNIATGLYDPSMDTKAFKADRDSQYLQQYGMPYSEVQAAEAAAASAQERAMDEQGAMAEDQAMEMFNQDVFERTGINGSDLAGAVDLAPEQLLAYLDSPNYAEAKQLVEDSGGDQATLAELAATLQTSDPTLWRILQAEFELPEPEFDLG